MPKDQDELELLRTRLTEAEETLEAIRGGEVDALVVKGSEGEQIYTLRGADHPYRLLLQEMNEGAATVTPEGTVLYCNKRFAEMLRRPIEKVIGYALEEFTHFRSQTFLEALLRSGRHICVKDEIAFTTPDGPLPVYCSIGPVDFDDLKSLILVATDLSEQKRSEEILASGRLASEILEHAVDVIVVCDEDGTVTRASRAAHELAGVNVLQRRFDDVFRLTETDGIRLSCSVSNGGREKPSIIAACLEGRTIQGAEVEFIRADGRKFDLLMSAGPLHGARKELRGCVFTLTDISGLKAAEEELKRSQAQLSAELSDSKLLQAISAALIHEENAPNLYEKILDAAVAIMRSDFASMQMLYPERGDGGELYLLAYRGFTAEAARFWERVRIDSESSCGAALRDGTRIIIEDVDQCAFMRGTDDLAISHQTGIQAVQSTPLLSRGGKLVGMISTHWRKAHAPSERDLRLFDILARQAADLIERKRAEEALRESEDKLRRQAQELEQQLIASGRLVSLGEITASMAHEFNNPLGIVLGFTEDLLMDKQPSDPEYQALKIIHEETKRCQKIIRDLMEYSRPRSVEKHGCDAGALVEKSLQLIANRLHKQKIETTVEIEPHLPPIEADPRQIEQVLLNLYLNAIDAMPDGGKLTVSVQCGGEATLTITVSDTGIGISAEDLPKIFQPFFSVKKKSGLGLGLPICRRILANHGGKIQVESPPGAGTIFRVSLPLKDAEAAVKSQSAA